MDNFQLEFNNLFALSLPDIIKLRVSQHYYSLFKSKRADFLEWLQYYIIQNEDESLLEQYINISEERIPAPDRKIKLKVLQYWVDERKRELYENFSLKTEKDIIDLINHDLNYTHILFQQQLRVSEYLSYVIAGNRVYLDYEKLGTYLRNAASNLTYLNSILMDFMAKVQDIINLHNNELKELEQRTRDRNIHSVLDFEEDGFSTFNNNFKCLRINDFTVSIVNLDTRANRVRFVNSHEYVIWDSHDFARRCNMIMQRITGFLDITSIEERDKVVSDRQLKLAIIKSELSTEILAPGNDSYRQDIFKNQYAFKVYYSLHSTYQNGKNNLADYSFIYHKMKYDNLLLHSVTSTTYLEFLRDEGIEIPKVKALKEIGKITYRQDAYNRAKISTK